MKDYDSDVSDTSLPEDDPNMTPCYNCNGAKTDFMCSMPIMGCVLCRTYGDGEGNMLKKYRYRELEIEGIKLSPPMVTCIWCNDSKKIERNIWDHRMIDDEDQSDFAERYMPLVILPCFKCQNDQYEKDLAEVKKILNSKDPVPYKKYDLTYRSDGTLDLVERN